MKKDSAIRDKSYQFALDIIELYQFMTNQHNLNREFVLSKQILRSGTSIGANIRESQRAQTIPDFITKLYIALKEADETSYWLELIHKTGYISEEKYSLINDQCEEIIKLISSIIIKTKRNHPEFYGDNNSKF